MAKEIDLENLGNYVKALHCKIRWVLIDILREGPKTSEEIFNFLRTTSQQNKRNLQNHRMYSKGDFKSLKKPSLYYHLRELENVGIIKAKYKPSESGRAPEKVWNLNIDKLIIKFRNP